MVVGRVSHRLMEGEVQPGFRDALTARDMLARFLPDPAWATEEDFVEAFMIYHEVVERHMTRENFEAFNRELSQNPLLDELIRQYDATR
jgi:hypothetical protein